MSLQLILGGSGSGKTTFVYQNIIDVSIKYPEKQYIVVVPEQFTMQTQKDIVTLHPNHGTMNIDIVSFERLAYRIFEELEVVNLEVLDDIGKSMVLRKVTANLKKELTLFQGHLNKTGFINQLKSMLSEFYQYGVTCDTLTQMMDEAKTPLLKQKLTDFSVVLEGFQSYLEGHYITSEEVLDVLCHYLPQSDLIKQSVIVLDGYTGFTPVQYRLIELCLMYAKQVILTITADQNISLEKTLGIQNLFYMSSQVVTTTKALAQKNQVAILKDIWVQEHVPSLHFLEQNLFRYTAKTGKVLNQEIQIKQANNPSQEVAGVVRIMGKYIQEQGLRYRDFAIVTGDLEGYGKEISRQLEQAGISYFLDDKKMLLDNPMVEFVRAALEVVQKDFSYESVFRLLRTGLLSKQTDLIDVVENYVLALGIRGYKRWNMVWERTYRTGEHLNLVTINEFREEVVSLLEDFREQVRDKEATIAQKIGAMIALLECCEIQEKIEDYQTYFKEQASFQRVKEYEQVYEMVIQLLERMGALLGDEIVDQKEFIEILEAGLQELQVGLIPATVDRVVVGDITRTRLAHIKVLFFMGVNDGIIPLKRQSGSLLSDQEREFFTNHQIALAPTAREDSFIQRFYLYLMVTKPSEKLMISYSNVGPDGKSRRASYFVGEMKKMFPALVVEQDEFQELYSVQEAKQALVEGFENYRDQMGNQDKFLELFQWFYSQEQYKKELEQLVEAAFYTYETEGITKAVSKALYGQMMTGSVTRLEQYAMCAYRHFLSYGLELMERKKYQLAAVDMGNLFHNALDLCFQKAKEQELDWRTMSDEVRMDLVRMSVEEVTGEYGNTILSSSARYGYLAKRVEQMTQRTVWALQEQICRGDFSPAGFEVSFSFADRLDAMNIALSKEETLRLRGRIDRVDLYETDQQVYVKVIDYKSGSTTFDLVALYYGLQLQLVVYMDAVMELTKRKFPSKEVIPAGILYYNINDPMITKAGKQSEEEINQEILKKLKMNGLLNSDLEVIHHMDHTIEKESDILPIVMKNGVLQEGKSSVASKERLDHLQTFVHNKLKVAGQEILSGNTEISPYKQGVRQACEYCPYHAVCGFDKKISGYDYKRLKPKKTEEIWEELCQ